EPIQVLGDLATGLVVKVRLKLGDHRLRPEKCRIDVTDTLRIFIRQREGVSRLREKAQGPIIHQQDELAGTGGEDRLGLVRAGVSDGRHRDQSWADRSSDSTIWRAMCSMIARGG